MAETLRFKQGSKEWLEARQGCLTATELPILFGMNSYKSVADLVASKTGEPTKLEDNIYMRAGRLLEPSVFIAMSDFGITCSAVDSENVVMLRDRNLGLSCSLDGKSIHPLTGEKVILEAKTTGKTKFVKWMKAPPEDYLIQVHTQLLLSNTRVGLLACMSTEFPFNSILYEVRADPRIVQKLKSATINFWNMIKLKSPCSDEDSVEMRELLHESYTLVAYTQLSTKSIDIIKNEEYYRK
jgi:putative phage-type endonuclease